MLAPSDIANCLIVPFSYIRYTFGPFSYDRQLEPFHMTEYLALFIWQAIDPFLYNRQLDPFHMREN